LVRLPIWGRHRRATSIICQSLILQKMSSNGFVCVCVAGTSAS